MTNKKKEEINQYLTEEAGRCWHVTKDMAVFGDVDIGCGKCGEMFSYKNTDFFTPLGYDKLRDYYDEWDVIRQSMFYVYLKMKLPQCSGFLIGKKAFHKDHFAELIYGFLKDGI